MYEKYIQEIDKAVFLATRQPTGVYEWDGRAQFGRQIHVGDIVEIQVERKLESKPYDFQRVMTRGVVYLQHGTFKIDINNEYSAALCRPRGNEQVERTVSAGWSRALEYYSIDRLREQLPHFPKGCSGLWRYIRILGNIAENPELLVR